jgi:hypothetical protein
MGPSSSSFPIRHSPRRFTERSSLPINRSRPSAQGGRAPLVDHVKPTVTAPVDIGPSRRRGRGRRAEIAPDNPSWAAVAAGAAGRRGRSSVQGRRPGGAVAGRRGRSSVQGRRPGDAVAGRRGRRSAGPQARWRGRRSAGPEVGGATGLARRSRARRGGRRAVEAERRCRLVRGGCRLVRGGRRLVRGGCRRGTSVHDLQAIR